MATLALTLAPVLIVGLRLFGPSAWRGFLRSLPTLLLATALLVGLSYAVPWGVQPFVAAEAREAAAEEDYELVDVEALYYAQPGLMDEALGRLEPERPGRVDLYGLLVGGTAHESVFLSEVDLAAGGRTVVLANSRAAPQRYPMANRANLARALGALALAMNPDEDVAFLFLTSHGSPEHFALSFWEAGTRGLEAGELPRMLAESGLRNAVIVLSACCSGFFVDDLAAPDRLVITAADADSTSFGCGDGREWTWWGRAFFEEALGRTRDFRQAFTLATALVADWEAAEGRRPSAPQMAVGEGIVPRLDRLAAELARAEP